MIDSAQPPAIACIHADDALLIVDKPAGMAMHRSHLVGADADYFIDRLRLQFDGPLHLVNRLDRATSGLVVVARSRELAAVLGEQFMARAVAKTYLAIVRGWPDESGEIDYPLTGAAMSGPRKPALTSWRRIATVEVPVAMGRYAQQRYALLMLEPLTGRYRQLRRHLHHVHHPVIGDTTHGRGDHNRLFKQHFRSHRLLLHAWRLSLDHPVDRHRMEVHAPLDSTWQRLVAHFNWSADMANAGVREPMTMATASYNSIA
jgi:tRNA pseudouridine65 synthase